MSAEEFLNVGQKNIELLLGAQRTGGAAVAASQTEFINTLQTLRQQDIYEKDQILDREQRAAEVAAQLEARKLEHADSVADAKARSDNDKARISVLQSAERDRVTDRETFNQINIAKVITGANDEVFRQRDVVLNVQEKSLTEGAIKLKEALARVTPAPLPYTDNPGLGISPPAVNDTSERTALIKDFHQKLERSENELKKVQDARLRNGLEHAQKTEDAVKGFKNIFKKAIPVSSIAPQGDLPDGLPREMNTSLLPEMDSSGSVIYAPEPIAAAMPVARAISADGVHRDVAILPIPSLYMQSAVQAAAGRTPVISPNFPAAYITGIPAEEIDHPKDTITEFAEAAPKLSYYSLKSTPAPISAAETPLSFTGAGKATLPAFMSFHQQLDFDKTTASEPGLAPGIKAEAAVRVVGRKAVADQIELAPKDLGTYLDLLTVQDTKTPSAANVQTTLAAMPSNTEEDKVKKAEYGLRSTQEAMSAARTRVMESPLSTNQKLRVVGAYEQAVLNQYRGDTPVSHPTELQDPGNPNSPKRALTVGEVASFDAYQAKIGTRPYREAGSPTALTLPVLPKVLNFLDMSAPPSISPQAALQLNRVRMATAGTPDGDNPAPFGVPIARDWLDDGKMLNTFGAAEYKSALANSVKEFESTTIANRIIAITNLGGVNLKHTSENFSGLLLPNKLETPLGTGSSGPSFVPGPAIVLRLSAQAIASRQLLESYSKPENREKLLDLYGDAAVRYANFKINLDD